MVGGSSAQTPSGSGAIQYDLGGTVGTATTNAFTVTSATLSGSFTNTTTLSISSLVGAGSGANGGRSDTGSKDGFVGAYGGGGGGGGRRSLSPAAYGTAGAGGNGLIILYF
jgi:hypothetical protein